jgi:predicted HTH transcriptional regulator
LRRATNSVTWRSSAADPLPTSILESKVFRAMIAICNVRDGGYVIMGIEEGGNHELKPIGVSDHDAASWNHDDVADKVNRHADPYVSCDIYRRVWRNTPY